MRDSAYSFPSLTRGRLALEAAACLGVLAALTVAELAITRNAAVVSHPMWLDECVSALLLTDPSFTHMAAAIRGGVDTNGPAFYLVAWPLIHGTGATSIAALRLVSAAAMLVALTGMYVTCRRFIEPGRAAIGVLAIAAHPSVLVQTWQFRMYGFWLAAAAWFCAYAVLAGAGATWRARTIGCLLAMLLVTSHWLGVFALVLVSCGALILTRADRDRRLNHALPLAAGLLTLLACVPLIMAQHRILTVATWIEPASLHAVLVQLRELVVVPSMAVAAGYLGIRLVQRFGPAAALAGDPWPAVPVLALLLYPAALIGMSIAMQSVLVERYMLPAVVALALVAGALALPVRRWVGAAAGVAAAAALVAMACLELNGLRAATREDDERAAHVVEISERVLGEGRHLVFARRFEAYPLVQARPQLADSVAVLDVTRGDGLMARTLFERDLGRAVARFYPQYHLVSLGTLREWRRFTVVTNSDEEEELRRLLPGFQLTRVGVDEYTVATE